MTKLERFEVFRGQFVAGKFSEQELKTLTFRDVDDKLVHLTDPAALAKLDERIAKERRLQP